MGAPPVSVIVVSRGRPGALVACLTGLAQQDYPAFELVVVADPGGLRAARDWAGDRPLKTVAYDLPNISAARNRGLAQAAGEVAAFIDDDAVPEPLWLHHLTAPFVRSEVAAAGGFVRGRNGISYQWRASTADATGRSYPLETDPVRPAVLHPGAGRAVRTEGTNMAFRRDVLAAIGGFDPAFRFYLDETDVNMRLARAGHATAIVPLAEVHHGFMAGPYRRADRVPTDLSEIGASQAVFLRKHFSGDPDPVLDEFMAAQRARLLRLMVRGPLGPNGVARLMCGLRAGIAEGRERSIEAAGHIARAARGFAAFPHPAPGDHLVISGPHWRRRALRRIAADRVAEGHRVSLFVFSRTGLYHHVRFRAPGYWEQTGGIFGRGDRSDPLLTPCRMRQRLAREVARVARQRGLKA